MFGNMISWSGLMYELCFALLEHVHQWPRPTLLLGPVPQGGQHKGGACTHTARVVQSADPVGICPWGPSGLQGLNLLHSLSSRYKDTPLEAGVCVV